MEVDPRRSQAGRDDLPGRADITGTWALVFVALAMLSNAVLDDLPWRIAGVVFGLLGLVLALVHLMRVIGEGRR